jgi:hypothetical protein
VRDESGVEPSLGLARGLPIGPLPQEIRREGLMTRRQGSRLDGREAFLKKLRRFPADRALMRFGEGRKARDFWNLVQYVLDRR